MREIAPFEEPDFSSKLIDLKRYFFDNVSSKLCPLGISEEIQINDIPYLLDAY